MMVAFHLKQAATCRLRRFFPESSFDALYFDAVHVRRSRCRDTYKH